MHKGIFAPVVSGYLDFLKLIDPAAKIVLSLSGGSFAGVAGHIAFLSVLEELKLTAKIEAVWGTSAGATVGSMLAAGFTSTEMEEVISSMSVKLFPINLYDIFTQFFLKKREISRSGIFSLKKVKEFGLDAIGSRTLKLPFHAITYNVSESKKTVLTPHSREELMEAACASMAFPGIFNPSLINGSYLIDGSSYENLPARSICEKWQQERALEKEPREKLIIIGNFINEYFSRFVQKRWDRRQRLVNFVQVFQFFHEALGSRVFERDLEYILDTPNVELILFHPVVDIGNDFTRIPFGIKKAKMEIKTQLEGKLYFVMKS